MAAISIIICTHNPRENYLRRVLDALKAQTLPASEWELLLVDNASEKPLAGRVDLSWHAQARHVREEKLGLTHARLRGIAESKADLLVFVDDDNVLRADYLQVCRKISTDFPWLGAWNGSCIPEYETEPAAELRPFLYGLVVDKLTTSVWAKLPVGGLALPQGAGLAVRRKQATHYREQVLRDPLRQALDRSGKGMSSGGDSDLALSGFELGLGAGRFPELELTHLIPSVRLTLDYLERLFEGFGYGGSIVAAIHDQRRRQPGELGSSALKIFLLRIMMIASGKSRAERVIRLAEERGRLAARRELERLGPLKSSPPVG
jgi:Glycosyl transferase family 2